MNLSSVYCITERDNSMARTNEQNERMIMATRKKIIDAGLKLFAQKGFAITAIKDNIL